MNFDEIISSTGDYLGRVPQVESSSPAEASPSDAGGTNGSVLGAPACSPASDSPSGSAAVEGVVVGASERAVEPEPSSTPADDPAATRPVQDPAAPVDEPAVRWHYYANKGAVQFVVADCFVGGRLDRMKLARGDGNAWRLTIETEVDSTCHTPVGNPTVADCVLHGSATDARRMALALLRSHAAAVAKKHRHNAHRRARATAARERDKLSRGGGAIIRQSSYLRIRRLRTAA